MTTSSSTPQVALSATLPASWPSPAGVRALTTLRHGPGGSSPPFDRLNLGNRHAADGDDARMVERNRGALVEWLNLPAPPHWLRQVHGVDVARFDASALLPRDAEEGMRVERVADAAVTSAPGTVLAILTADCLPVVFAAIDGSEVAVTHAGWLGLSGGVLESTMAAMRTPPSALMAWLGPAAGPQAYEIGQEVYDRFLAHDPAAGQAFTATRPGHWLADLYALARMRLAQAGVAIERIHGGGLCTISDPQRFFSYRRDKRTGRMATLVWMQP